jgi:hypothetical protein
MTTADTVYHLYDRLWSDFPEEYTVRSFLEAQAICLTQAQQQQNPSACVQISNWHPAWLGKSAEQILEAAFSEADGRLTLAKEYGFSDWTQVEAVGDGALNVDFETAVNAIISGQTDTLQTLLSSSPELIKQRSQFGHGATLLIYIAANGVETWRQKVPANAVEITRILLDAGADVNAKATVYGAQYDTMALLMSSAHPAQAGLTEQLTVLLKQAGAEDDHL